MPRLFLQCFRAFVRSCQTDALQVNSWSRAWRYLCLGPVLNSFFVAFQGWAKIFGTTQVEGTSPEGLRFRCALPDIIPAYIWLFGVWEPDVFAFLSRRLRPGDIMLDIGANIGFDALYGAARVGATGEVIALEPCPPILAKLRENLRLNPDYKVAVLEFAAASQRKAIPIFSGPVGNTGQTTTLARRRLTPAGEVVGAPLEELVSPAQFQRTRLIKIDVEGAEPDVLKTVAANLNALPHNAEILVELSPAWWPDTDPNDVLRPFVEHGYHVYFLPNDYSAVRYLWPNAVQPPRRLHSPITTQRLDLVLSRVDAETL